MVIGEKFSTSVSGFRNPSISHMLKVSTPHYSGTVQFTISQMLEQDSLGVGRGQQVHVGGVNGDASFDDRFRVRQGLVEIAHRFLKAALLERFLGVSR